MRLDILALPALISAATVEIYVPATAALPNPNTLPSSSRATLSSGGISLTAPISRAGIFTFKGVEPGSYLLSAHSRDTAFENLRVDVSVNSDGSQDVRTWTTFRGNEWDNKGESRGSGEGRARVELRAIAKKDFYQQRASFSLASLFKNPMILMALFTLVMVVGMPWLMDNLDPEIKKEVEEMQKSKKGVTASTTSLTTMDFAGDFANWMAKKPTPAAQKSKK